MLFKGLFVSYDQQKHKKMGPGPPQIKIRPRAGGRGPIFYPGIIFFFRGPPGSIFPCFFDQNLYEKLLKV